MVVIMLLVPVVVMLGAIDPDVRLKIMLPNGSWKGS
jgi:hypothetical protein